MHLKDLEIMTSFSISLLQEEELPFEQKLIGISNININFGHPSLIWNVYLLVLTFKWWVENWLDAKFQMIPFNVHFLHPL